jgi:hypothetical protein
MPSRRVTQQYMKLLREMLLPADCGKTARGDSSKSQPVARGDPFERFPLRVAEPHVEMKSGEKTAIEICLHWMARASTKVDSHPRRNAPRVDRTRPADASVGDQYSPLWPLQPDSRQVLFEMRMRNDRFSWFNSDGGSRRAKASAEPRRDGAASVECCAVSADEPSRDHELCSQMARLRLQIAHDRSLSQLLAIWGNGGKIAWCIGFPADPARWCAHC